MSGVKSPGNLSAGSDGSGVLLWFRNDLRLHDNACIARALEDISARRRSSVLPVYCFDPDFFGASEFGLPKTGPFRASFLLQSVLNLKQQLRGIGSDLLVLTGRPSEQLPSLFSSYSFDVVYAQAEVTTEEVDVEKAVARAIQGRAELCLEWGMTMFHPEDLPYSPGLEELPDSFTAFRREVEDQVAVRPVHSTPTHGQLPLPPVVDLSLLEQIPASVADLPESTHAPDAPANEIFNGGETSGLCRLQYYFWETDLVANYFNTRNGMLGRDYSTKFSPWLAHGCLSPRMVYYEVLRYESERTANKSTYWVIFELFIRDFFKFYAAKQKSNIFLREGIKGLGFQWDPREELFERWRDGRTGYPLVDANMRELNATGYMSNRGRQNVASFLIMDYGVDWRRGADYFEHMLLDYDVAVNWGNWVHAAGLTGGRMNRFNVVKQSKDYDADGEYLRAWLPELGKCPASRIHEPWLMTPEEQEKYRVVIGEDYPAPIPEDDLPFTSLKQMERIKLERAVKKRAEKAAARQAAKPEDKQRRQRRDKKDKYSYHEDKDTKKPVGIDKVGET